MPFDRRHFLKALGGSAGLAVFGGPVLAAPASPAALPGRRLILIYLMGGNDGYNTLVPFQDKRYYTLRPTVAVPRERVIPLTATHGLNAALAPLMPAWRAGELAWLQGIGLPEVHDQHYSDYERLVTGAAPDEYLGEGWASRALAAESGSRSLDAVAFDSLDIREGDAMGPFRGRRLKVINAPFPSELAATRDFASGRQIITPALQGRAIPPFAALPLSTRFPDEPFGQALRLAVELAHARPDLPVIHITLDSLDGDRHHCFDTHWKQSSYQPAGLARLGGGLAALRTALMEAGLWDSTLVATYDEFGRSPKENQEQGTEHGWANSHLVMGGRVKGGFFGRPPALVDVHWIGGDQPVIDYRALYTTVIESWWGRSAAGLFSDRFRPLDLVRA